MAGALYRTFRSQEARVRRALKRIPRVDIRDAADEAVVRIVGRVHVERETLASPLTGQPCVAFQLFAESAEGEEGSSAALDLRGARPFAVADQTGDVLVDTEGPYLLALRANTLGSTGGLFGNRAHAQTLASLTGTQAKDMKSRAYREGVLKDGDRVVVGGRGTWTPDPRRGGLRQPVERLVICGTAEQPVLIARGWRDLEER